MSTPGQYPQPQQYPQQNAPQPQQQGGYYPAPQGQAQYAAPQATSGNLWGIILVGAGGVLAVVGLILCLVADFDSGSGFRLTSLGGGLLTGGLVMVGLWLTTMALDAQAKARK